MGGRFTPLVLCFLVLLLWLSNPVLGADPSLIGWWPFNEVSGTVAADASGSGNDGTLSDNVTWDLDGGSSRGAAFYDGTNTAHVEISAAQMSASAGTFMVWGRMSEPQPSQTRYFFGHTTQPAYGSRIQIYMDTDTMDLDLGLGGAHAHNTDIVRLNTEQWYHVALTWNGTTYGLYLDGQTIATGPYTGLSAIADIAWIGNDGNPDTQGTEAFAGWLDEARLYNRALSLDEIQMAMETFFEYGMAYYPTPADSTIDVLRDVVLSWTAGELAQSHDVYFGTSFDDVNDATRQDPRDVLISQGHSATEYDLGTLDYETTYYWRVDEVGGEVFKGNVWQFTTELFAYPIKAVVATSNAVPVEGQGPENVVNGSGLNANGEHSTETSAMWRGSAGDETPYIQFEFNRSYKLYEMQVWNYNIDFESFLGIGVKDVTVQSSFDGVIWDTFGDVQLAQAPGVPTNTANSIVSLEGIGARYLRLVINSTFGGYDAFGLGEVRFRYIPVRARDPEPVDGTADLDVDTDLAWRPGYGAVLHGIYLSTSETLGDSVGTTTEPSFDPGMLELGAVYSWKITEINSVSGEVWDGDVWQFSTKPYLEIDGFEAYDDDIEASTTVWQSWVDGIDDSTNGGGVVGYGQSPFAEQVIVHRGLQSMPFGFTNDSASAFSEADYTFDSTQDWTVGGIKMLSLWFYGTDGNAGRLYVKINGVKVLYDGQADDIATAGWKPWNIDLSTVGVNLTNVTTLSLGVEGTGSGQIYVDDVRLYPESPNALGLAAYYPLDGSTVDASGHGLDGFVYGQPIYGDGVLGQALRLDGVDDYVAVTDVGIAPGAPRTVAGWAKAETLDIPAWTNVFGFTGPSGNNGHFDIECVGDGSGSTLGNYGLHRYGWERDIIAIDLEWHHLAATYDGTAVAWYGDGQLISSEDVDAADIASPGRVQIGSRADNSNYFPGSVDEVRIYDRALSAEELAQL